MPRTCSLPPRVSDPDMLHGTCVMHVPWCILGSLTSGFIWSQWRGKRCGIPGACATRNFAYLVRGPWWITSVCFAKRLIYLAYQTAWLAYFYNLPDMFSQLWDMRLCMCVCLMSPKTYNGSCAHVSLNLHEQLMNISSRKFHFHSTNSLPCAIWAPSQYPDRNFKIVISLWNWQAHRQHCCRSARQISERSDSSKHKSHGFGTSRDLTIIRLIGYWDEILVYMGYQYIFIRFLQLALSG